MSRKGQASTKHVHDPCDWKSDISLYYLMNISHIEQLYSLADYGANYGTLSKKCVMEASLVPNTMEASLVPSKNGGCAMEASLVPSARSQASGGGGTSHLLPPPPII